MKSKLLCIIYSWRALFLYYLLGVTTASGIALWRSIPAQGAELRGLQGSQNGFIRSCTGQRLELSSPQLSYAHLKALTLCGSKTLPQLTEALKSPNWKVKVAAAHTLGLLGSAARVAVPQLSNLIQDQIPDVRFVSAQALGEIGTDAAVPALVRALQDQDENVRFAAAEGLNKLGSDARDAIPILKKTLRDGNWFVRSRVADAFVHLTPQNSLLTPELVEAVLKNKIEESPYFGGNTEYHLQRQQKIPVVVAFDALAEIGHAAAPPLIDALKSDNIIAAAPIPTLALSKIGSGADSERTIALLIQALQHPDWTIRQNAASVLEEIGSKASIPALVNMAPINVVPRDYRWGPRPHIALGRIGFRIILGRNNFSYKENQTTKLIPALSAALQNEDWQVRAAAAAALGLTSKAAIPSLHRFLQDPDWQVRSTAATALGCLSSEAAIPSLVAAAQDKDWRVRRNVAYALNSMEHATPVLRSLLEDPNEEVRLAAAIALGEESDFAVPILIAALQKHKDIAKRLEILEALDKLASEAAILAVTQALQDESPIIRDKAAFKLGFKLSSSHKLSSSQEYPLVRSVAIPALIKALKDENEQVRIKVAQALEDADETAVPALIEAAQDKNEQVRSFAIDALGKIGSQSALAVITVALQDENELVQSAAANALAQFKSVPQALNRDLQNQALNRDLQNTDWRVRRDAVEKLGLMWIDLNPSSLSPAAQALVKALEDSNLHVRTSAIAILVRSNSRGGALTPAVVKLFQKAVPDLVNALQKGDSLSRLDAIFLLGAAGSRAKAAIPSIHNALKDENWLVRYAAAVTLLKINPKDKLAIPVLAEIFKNPSYAEMIEIDQCCTDHDELDTLAKNGSKEAIAALVNTLQISDEKFRYTYYLGSRSDDFPPTAEALLKVGDKAIPALIAALEEENRRFITAEILGQMGAKAIPPLLAVLQRQPSPDPALKEILKDKDADLRRSVVYALGQIGMHSPGVKAIVIERMMVIMKDQNEHQDVRWMATVFLDKLGQPVDQFFAVTNRPKPSEEHCTNILFSKFDIYAGRCLYAEPRRGAGLSQIYQQIRALLSRKLPGVSTTPKPKTSPTK